MTLTPERRAWIEAWAKGLAWNEYPSELLAALAEVERERDELRRVLVEINQDTDAEYMRALARKALATGDKS